MPRRDSWVDMTPEQFMAKLAALVAVHQTARSLRSGAEGSPHQHGSLCGCLR
jgi:hypothetical protein